MLAGRSGTGKPMAGEQEQKRDRKRGERQEERER